MDGFLDVVVGNDAPDPKVVCLNGSFSAAVPLGSVTATPYALAVGDLNRDGKIDIVVGYVDAPSVVYFNEGTGRGFAAVPFGDGKGAAYGIAIGDLNKDGWPDIAIARSGPRTLSISAPAPPNARSEPPGCTW